MTVPHPATVELAELENLGLLGSGGQGIVHRVMASGTRRPRKVAYKEYHSEIARIVDWSQLARLIQVGLRATAADRAWLGRYTAWPIAIVQRHGDPCGFLMRIAPDECLVSLRTGREYESVLLSLEFLMNSPDYLARVDLRLSERDRITVLRTMASLVDRLHSLNIVIGDLSPKNVAISLESNPQCFLLDCDAVSIDGESPVPPVETPDWTVPVGESATARSSDLYKLGLCVVRVLCGDQSAMDSEKIPSRFSALASIARRAIDGPPGCRPTAAEWMSALGSAAGHADRNVPAFVTLPPPPPIESRAGTVGGDYTAQPDSAVRSGPDVN
jgi:serine/threonine protein kinase